MKSLIIVSILSLAVFGLFSCSTEEENTDYYTVAYEQYNQNNYSEALTNFKKLLEKEKDTENAKKAVFMIGFINANHIHNFEEAKKYYEEFLTKYPDHELASSAQYELSTLGKDINDLPIFKTIEEKEGKKAE